MSRKRFALVALALLLPACHLKKLSGLVDVNVQVVDEKTLLERQILGAYQGLEKDLVMVASVRSIDTEGRLEPLPSFPPGQRKALEAMRVRELYRDDVDAFKKEGVLGEGKDGYLASLPPAEKLDPKQATLAKAVVAAENGARKAIIDRVMETSEGLSSSDRGKVEQVFARMNRDASREGDWVQADDGRWERKAAAAKAGS